MEKNSSTFNFKRWPKAFLIALIVVCIVEMLVLRYDEYFYYPPFNNLRMKVKNDIALSPARIFDAVILGDSYLLTGLDPRPIQDQTNLRVFNYSTFAVNSILSSYLLFRNQVSKEASRPQYLILGYLDYVPQFDRDTILSKYGHTLFDFKRGNIGLLSREFGIVTGLKLMIPSLKHQGYFLVMSKPTPLSTIRQVERSVYDQHGYYEWHVDRAFDGHYGYENDQVEFAVTPFFDKHVRQILSLAQQHQMRVLYIIPSVVPQLDDRLKKAGRRAAYRDYILSLQRDFPNVEIYEAQKDFSEEGLYTDQDHLNQRGGEKLGRIVTRWILSHPVREE